MPPRRRRSAARRRTGLRAALAGVVLLGAVGSCELPKPQLPSIGSASGACGMALVAPGQPRPAASGWARPAGLSGS